MIVVDTNVVAYLLIEGDRTSSCRKVLVQDSEWCAPFLWRSEFRNVLTLHVRGAGMPIEGALRRATEAERLFAGREYSVATSAILSLSLAERIAVSAYDAEFVCLAEKLGTKLVTTDKSILRHFPELALSPEQYTAVRSQPSD